ncbi:DUF2332 domain-containing protein [Plantactinospora sp. KLBMP9567]|uniref:DUF2332 domain-containing protein n=1 Tax=Plantactinospora sp. KLBMP9567 TaxID=3085900 RepID=UPI00298112BB|nr:DUF2332 domain-containing protein [Plantactinospora sp. KLBMP9567]MDW5325291.1 DUF2332 domain-containing protein [Plantactinospora sp. KLBMP9567]
MATAREIDELEQHFAAAPATFTTSPLYRALCPVVAGDRSTLELLTGRRPGQQASYLFFGAAHYLLLAGARHPLRDFYPSLVGPSAAEPADAGPVLRDFCRRYRTELGELVRTRLVQTNVVRRAVALRYALWAIGQRCAGPVHLVEVGSSAGIHLYVDRYRYLVGDRVFGAVDATVTLDSRWLGRTPLPDLDDVPPIASRTGVDLNPVDVTDAHARRWLRALVWPENQDAATLLDAALDVVATEPPAVVAGDAVQVCPALGRGLPPGEPRVVFHAATRMHVPAGRRAAFDRAIDSIGEGGPLYHVWQEPPSAPHGGHVADPRGELAMHGPDGVVVPLLRVDGHLRWLGPLGRPD